MFPCSRCSGSTRLFGFNRNGSQRYRCEQCRRTFTVAGTAPRDGRRLTEERAVLCLRMLLEGNSIRATSRLTGVDKRTIIGLMVDTGRQCIGFLETAIHGIPVANVQADEIWGFVWCKEKHRNQCGLPEEGYGDAYCYTALERTSKLLVAWHLGKRSVPDTYTFARKLRRATTGSFQLTTDGWHPYRSAIPTEFGQDLDFAVLIKDYVANPDQRRYSPPEIVSTMIRIQTGDPDERLICTSHVERHNRTLRMQIRRLTRLTDAHSKKWQNHEAALALFFAYYNYCRVHMTLKTTPAVKAGLTDHAWTMQELLQRIATV